MHIIQYPVYSVIKIVKKKQGGTVVKEGSKIEISGFVYKNLKTKADKYSDLSKSLLEYMGYRKEFLISKSRFNQLMKDELVEIILEQRAMIKKLIYDLDSEKRQKHMQELDNLYMKNKISAD